MSLASHSMENPLTLLLQALSRNNSSDFAAGGVSIPRELGPLLLPVIVGLVVLLFRDTGPSHKGKPMPGPLSVPIVTEYLALVPPGTLLDMTCTTPLLQTIPPLPRSLSQ